MSTAQIIYEQYKVLPKKLQNELKSLINSENEEETVPLIEQVAKGLREVKLIREGKLPRKTFQELKHE
jgi:peptide subunit release factor 1 (eRF1)